ncbi:Golgi apparatus membrane protein TVP23 [Paxillus ammoniavirescens]|nr:Golgi apparatus membrane protein TVP23 [Paxillus ammoniavirescens]
MSTHEPLLDTIEPDDLSVQNAPYKPNVSSQQRSMTPVVLTPGSSAMASDPNSAETGIAGMFKQSAHPAALFCLYLFRIAAVAVYILCGLFTDNYVLSTVAVVVLLAMDFWNCRNVAGRTLVGLRFWNQVDDDGESYWVFESRDPARPANPVDSKMFWIALYTFPAFWLLLFVVSIVKFNLAFVPIVILALVFNITNAVGFTYADRDSKQRWANSVANSGWSMGIGGLGGQILTGAVKSSVGRIFG